MKDAVSGTHFQFAFKDTAPIFLILVVNIGIVRVGDGFYFPIAFSRACSSVDVDVVGIGVGVGDIGSGG